MPDAATAQNSEGLSTVASEVSAIRRGAKKLAKDGRNLSRRAGQLEDKLRELGIKLEPIDEEETRDR